MDLPTHSPQETYQLPNSNLALEFIQTKKTHLSQVNCPFCGDSLLTGSESNDYKDNWDDKGWQETIMREQR